MPRKLATPVQVGTNITSLATAKLTASLLSSLMPPAPQPAPTPTSTQTVEKRPVKPPLPRPVPLDDEPQTPTPARTPLPPHLEYLLCPPTMPAVSSPGSTKFKQGGWGESAGSSPVVPESPCQPPHMTTASPVAGAPAPATDLLGKPSGAPDDEGSKLEFLQGVFSSMDPALVADVMHGVENNAEAAMQKLMALQALVDHTEVLDSSIGSDSGVCSESDLAAKVVSPSANGGEPWDVSGVPVDYSFKDLSDEQKVILIRRELSGCSVEEAMNSLEACSGDVDAAVAMLSQAYDRKDSKIPGTEQTAAPAEVLELKEVYSEIDLTTLGNVFDAAGKDTEIAKKMLADSGVAPFEQVAARKSAASGLFSQPAAAEVRAPTQQALIRTNARPNLMVCRSDADNQRLYKSQRVEALKLKREMEMRYAEAHKAWDRNDRSLSEQLMQRAHQCRDRYKAAQAAASENIFKRKNKIVQNSWKVELHALHVPEAIEKTDQIYRVLKDLPSTKTLELITGKGLHSEGNIARLLPAVEGYLKEKNLVYHVNGGCIIVDIPDVDDYPNQNRYAHSSQDAYEHG
ncbi:g11084 [Coccomyxa elongata]